VSTFARSASGRVQALLNYNGHHILWIASDNYRGSQTCNGVQGVAGLCFLPYPAQ